VPDKLVVSLESENDFCLDIGGTVQCRVESAMTFGKVELTGYEELVWMCFFGEDTSVGSCDVR